MSRLDGPAVRGLLTHAQRIVEDHLSAPGRRRELLVPGAYFAASCGGTPLTVVKQYIENRKRRSTLF
ncbi:hypothetical protein ABZV60_35845 [Streptomyces sp. NPDC004787]|uniref:hypothetical protein n=1 Tax=Streptomyces sp. NPDC004787 TaxID=3154291 RepID=UPI0033A9B909